MWKITQKIFCLSVVAFAACEALSAPDVDPSLMVNDQRVCIKRYNTETLSFPGYTVQSVGIAGPTGLVTYTVNSNSVVLRCTEAHSITSTVSITLEKDGVTSLRKYVVKCVVSLGDCEPWIHDQGGAA
jgi:hypothetical protein